MSRRLSVAVAFVLGALAIPVGRANAQLGYGVAAGISLPRGDFDKVTDAGYHVTGIVKVAAPLLPVGLRFEGSFSEYNYDKTLFSNSAKARILYATANAVLSSSSPILSPYLIGGLGVYHASAECSQCTTTSTKGGFNIGAGVRLGLSGFSTFLEARYHYIAGASDPTNGGASSSSTQFIPISFGVLF